MPSGVVTLAAVIAFSIVLGYVFVRLVSGPSPRSDEVLPSHYQSLLYARPVDHAGFCHHCETHNDPKRSVCRECSRSLPEERRRGRNAGIEAVQEQ